jgi:SAM-dependent methyltransferase
MTENPYTPDFFKTNLAHSYPSAKQIVSLVLEFLSIRSVLDVGCGTGYFLRAFIEAGVSEFAGVDGDYVPRDQLTIKPEAFHPVDLAGGFDLRRKYDLVVSLEVAEHLPADSADGFVDSLTKHSSVILFSAALPHQGGTGHVNEQWPSYWAQHFEKRGYRAYDILRPRLWHNKEVAWWYRQNVLLFANDEGCVAHPKLADLQSAAPISLDRVHPELYLLQLKRFEDIQKFLASGSMFETERSAEGKLNIKKIR